MTDLNTFIDPLLGWTLTNATAINDIGQIVGTAEVAGQPSLRGFLLTPVAVPEPSSLLAMTFGSLGIAVFDGIDASIIGERTVAFTLSLSAIHSHKAATPLAHAHLAHVTDLARATMLIELFSVPLADVAQNRLSASLKLRRTGWITFVYETCQLAQSAD